MASVLKFCICVERNAILFYSSAVFRHLCFSHNYGKSRFFSSCLSSLYNSFNSIINKRPEDMFNRRGTCFNRPKAFFI